MTIPTIGLSRPPAEPGGRPEGRVAQRDRGHARRAQREAPARGDEGGVSVRAARAEDVPLEEQRYSRRNLFRSLGGIVAEKGIVKMDEVKSRFTDV